MARKWTFLENLFRYSRFLAKFGENRRREVDEKSFRIAYKNHCCVGHVPASPQFRPHWADRTKNFLITVAL